MEIYHGDHEKKIHLDFDFQDQVFFIVATRKKELSVINKLIIGFIGKGKSDFMKYEFEFPL